MISMPGFHTVLNHSAHEFLAKKDSSPHMNHNGIIPNVRKITRYGANRLIRNALGMADLSQFVFNCKEFQGMVCFNIVSMLICQYKFSLHS